MSQVTFEHFGEAQGRAAFVMMLSLIKTIKTAGVFDDTQLYNMMELAKKINLRMECDGEGNPISCNFSPVCRETQTILSNVLTFLNKAG